MIFHQHDIATVKGRIELAVDGGAQVIFTSPDKTEHRLKIAADQIVGVEPGPLKSGDPVTKGKGAKAISGTIVHRVDDKAWVMWTDGTESLEGVSGLTR